MKYITKYMKVYESNFEGFVAKTHQLPSHSYLSYMCRRLSVPLDRVRVRFCGYKAISIPLIDYDDDLPF